jgi:hypothetical protein
MRNDFSNKSRNFAKGGKVPAYQMTTPSADAKGFKADKYPQQDFDKKSTAKAGLKGEQTMTPSAKGKKTGLGFTDNSGSAKSPNPKGQKFAKGGMVITSGSAPASRTVREADGIAQRGKTRGKQIAMKK